MASPIPQAPTERSHRRRPVFCDEHRLHNCVVNRAPVIPSKTKECIDGEGRVEQCSIAAAVALPPRRHLGPFGTADAIDIRPPKKRKCALHGARADLCSAQHVDPGGRLTDEGGRPSGSSRGSRCTPCCRPHPRRPSSRGCSVPTCDHCKNHYKHCDR